MMHFNFALTFRKPHGPCTALNWNWTAKLTSKFAHNIDRIGRVLVVLVLARWWWPTNEQRNQHQARNYNKVTSGLDSDYQSVVQLAPLDCYKCKRDDVVVKFGINDAQHTNPTTTSIATKIRSSLQAVKQCAHNNSSTNDATNKRCWRCWWPQNPCAVGSLSSQFA